ncbi:MAG: acetoacetyl-CoA synthetase [Paraglaciecola sp.]|jgi:acetoacetyl-CoA synthetase
MTTPLWSPGAQRIKNSNLRQFISSIDGLNIDPSNYQQIHQWSVEHNEDFWENVWQYFSIIAVKQGETVVDKNQLEHTQWFPQVQLNFTENLLSKPKYANNIALTEVHNDGTKTTITYQKLQSQVNNLAHYLSSIGVNAGDVVAGIMNNSASTVAACLATAQIGAIWTACSVDFGLDAITERFIQTQPKVLFTLGGLTGTKKNLRHQEKIIMALKKLPSIKHLLFTEHVDIAQYKNQINTVTTLADIPPIHREITYEKFPFNHPLYIVYSSGTTGEPKCIIHGVGGTLLQHIKELGLHTELTENDTLFFYTSCGWMMWNWMISGLALGANIILYDGSPISPTPSKLFDICQQEHVTVLGLNPRYLQACYKTQINFSNENKLPTLKTILSTGSVLSPYLYHYVYQNIKQDVLISSISGGTDIIGCFCLGTSLLPVYAGECQAKGLGFDVKAFNEQGLSLEKGIGELVCVNAFISRPLGLWQDESGEKFHQTYFNQYPDVWTHGDLIEITEHNGVIFHGRSDATLNPGGIRIGTAEIYRQLGHFPEIEDAIATELITEYENTLILFVKLAGQQVLDKALSRSIMRTIGQNTTENHVPNRIIAVPDLPRTYSGKTVELVVKNIINHRAVKNIKAIANPESLDFFSQFANNES